MVPTANGAANRTRVIYAVCAISSPAAILGPLRRGGSLDPIRLGVGVRARKAAQVRGIVDPAVQGVDLMRVAVGAGLFDTDLDAVAEALDLKCAQSVPKPRPVAAPGA